MILFFQEITVKHLLMIKLSLLSCVFCGCIAGSFEPYSDTTDIPTSAKKVFGKWVPTHEHFTEAIKNPKPWIFAEDSITTFGSEGAEAILIPKYFEKRVSSSITD